MSRDTILEKLRSATASSQNSTSLLDKEKSPTVYTNSKDSLLAQFTHNCNKLDVKLFLCEDKEDCKIQLQGLFSEKHWSVVNCIEPELQEFINTLNVNSNTVLDTAPSINVSITSCLAFIARTGSILVDSSYSRQLSIVSPYHIIIGNCNQIVSDIKDGIERLQMQGKSSLYSFIRGGSCTADIEKTLVKGAHGPKSLYIFITA